ncbi:MAG TPA: TlpA disulfide reductase family protein [Granulicella sp.]
MRRIVSILTLSLAILASGCERGSHPGNLGKPAPPFTVSDGAQTIDLQKLRGQVVVLNLWATWCTPCLEELPSLEEMQHQLPNVHVIGVSLDSDADLYRKFLTSHNINFPTVRDPDGKVNALYGTAQIPETYVIDRQGVLRRKYVSAQNWTSPEILRYLQSL